jgi:hypothetical protein
MKIVPENGYAPFLPENRCVPRSLLRRALTTEIIMSMFQCGKDIQDLRQRIAALEELVRNPASGVEVDFTGRQILYVSEAMALLPSSPDEAKGDGDEAWANEIKAAQPEAYYSVRWRGRFARNGGEMTGDHKVLLTTLVNNRISVRGRSSFCKNYANPLTLHFGFMVTVVSGNPRVDNLYYIANLRLGESKTDAYKDFGIVDNGRAIRDGNWYMIIST